MKLKLLALAALSCCSTIMMADKVYLKSGSYLTGTAGDVVGDSIKFVSDDLGEVTVKLANITKLESSREHVVQYKDLTTEKKALAVKDGALVEGDKKLDMSNVKAVDPVFETWHGSVNIAASMARGNTVSENASLTADLSRRWEKHRFTSALGYYFAQSGDNKLDKQKTENRFELSAQEDYFFITKLYGYVSGKYEIDEIMQLDHRIRLGAGLGYQWLEGVDVAGLGKMSFNQEVGGAWVKEKYENGYDDDFATVRYAHHYTWDFAKTEGLKFFHNFEYLPDLSDFTENYLIDADIGLSWAFSANWQLLAKFEWDYKSQVAEGVKHSDLRYILGLGYKW